MAKSSINLFVLVTAAIAIGALVLSACGTGLVVGSGNQVTEEREISDVEGVALSFIGDLRITQGDEEKLVITGDDNVVPLVTTEVRDGVLNIGSKSTLSIPMVTELRYDLTVRDLNSLRLSGAGNAQMDGLDTGDFAAAVSGAGNLEVRNLKANRVSANLSGVGNVELSGEASRQAVTLSGAGSYAGGDLETGAADVSLSGLGNATVWATESLNATISGAGNIEYYGDPDVTSRISGLGNVSSRGDK
jgi:hypothetical protein